MKIREVLSQLTKVQQGVSIAAPAPMQIMRVYPYLPPGQDAIDVPCVINQWRFVRQNLARGNGFRELRYVIRSQVFVAALGADFDKHSECAAELNDALLEAIAANLTLNGTVSVLEIRGDEAEYMPVVFERNGIGYIGLQYLMDILINDAVTVGP